MATHPVQVGDAIHPFGAAPGREPDRRRALDGVASGGSVLVIDDHALITQGLDLALADQGFEVHVRADADLEGALVLVEQHHPVLALVDLQLPGPDHSGLALIGPLAERTAVLVLTAVTDPGILGCCLESGALGVVSKSQPFERLLACIVDVLLGLPTHEEAERRELLDAACAHRAEAQEQAALLASLSPRERVVLDHLGQGLTAEAIAEVDYVSVATVRSQIRGVLRKLGVTSQLAAIARAHECGWRPTEA